MTTYRTGDTVLCPGMRSDRRRNPDRAAKGDRRSEARDVPCTHRWGRVGPETVVTVRVRRAHRFGQAGEWTRVATRPAGQTLILECPDCHLPIEFVTERAGEQAA